VESKSHKKKKLIQKTRFWKKTVSSAKSKKASVHTKHSKEDFKTKPAEKRDEYYHLQIHGDTLKQCAQDHDNAFLDGCSNFQPSRSSLSDKVNTQLYEPANDTTFQQLDQNQFDIQDILDEAANATFEEVPQNQLGILGAQDYWLGLDDLESLLTSTEDETNAYKECAQQHQQILPHITQNQSNTPADFSAEALNGMFAEPVCSDFHDNQVAFYKCHQCNPTTYQDYINW
jgi:hypothetical protein